MHSVGTLVDEDRDRRVGGCVGDGLDHLLHDERITDDQPEDPGRVSASFLTQHFASVKADELQQT